MPEVRPYRSQNLLHPFPLGFTLHSYYYISLLVSFIDIPVSFNHLFKSIASINDRFYLPRLNKFFEEGKIFGLFG